MARVRLALLILANLVLAVLIGAYIAAAWSERPLDETARAEAPGMFLETSQGRLHYRWYGKAGAPIIVMAHGYSTPNFIFTQNAGALAAAGYRVLTYDHFGRGWSDRPAVRFDDVFYERELLELLDGLQIDGPVGLVGLSMGGVTSTYFAAHHPDRVKALFLFVPAGFDLGADPDSAMHKIIMTPVLGDWIWRVFGKGVLRGDRQYVDAARAPEDRLAGNVAVQMTYQGYFRSLLSSYRHMQMFDRGDLYRALAQTGLPVMAVFGGQDTTVLPSSAEKFKTAVPQAEMRLIADGAHGLNYQMSETSNRLLVDYFAGHFPGGID